MPCAFWAQRPQLVKMAKGVDATEARLIAAMVKHKLSWLQIQAITGRSPASIAKYRRTTKVKTGVAKETVEKRSV